MELEHICIHKGLGCNKENVCDGQGRYYEKNEEKYCGREAFSEMELWRTIYMRMDTSNINKASLEVEDGN